MIWQDIVISIANLVFLGSVIYQIYHGYKIKECSIALLVSGMTTFGLIVVAVCFVTLSFYYSAIISLLSTICWGILFIQRIKYKKF